MRYFPAVCRLASFLITASVFSVASCAENLLLNPGIESGKGVNPSIWERAMVPAEGLRMERVTEGAKSGEAALLISNDHQYDKEVANNWMQSLQKVPVGASLRISGSIRTKDADSANVCIQCWDASGEKLLAFTSTPVVRGDQDWTRLSSGPMIVPSDTKTITVRAALGGKGKVWFDDLEVSSDDADPEHPGSQQAERDVQTSSQSLVETELPIDVRGRIVEHVAIDKDCMVLSYLPTWKNGNVDNIAVANNDGGVRTLFAWKPLAKKVLEGKGRRVYLAAYSRKTTASEKPSELIIQPLASDWPELTSWDSLPKADEVAESVTATFAPGDGWKLFDITPLLQKESANKFGVLMKFKDENQSGAKHNWSGYAFVSREGLGEWAARRPQLLIVEPATSSDDASPQALSTK